MSFEIMRSEMSSLFSAAFAAVHPTIPIAYDNIKFDQPNGAWVFFAVIPGNSHRVNIGTTKCFRHEGVINVVCMVPEDQGTKLLNEMVETVFSSLADQNIALGASGSVSLHETEVRPRGVIEGFNTTNVMVEFRRDQTLSS